ncbi:hypothetical protein [Bizionia sp.]|uniref:hypothetical protein n=1 Tax=Bizionia sp. TaxID=1954480 RepID=UPI003A93968B
MAVQYARRSATGGYEKNVFGGARQFIPLKLNARRMPIIFAETLCLFLTYWKFFFLEGTLLVNGCKLISQTFSDCGTMCYSFLNYSFTYFMQRLQYQRIKWLMI